MNPNKKYQKIQEIGQGSFGRIFKVMDRQSRQYLVLKEIDLSNLSPFLKQKSMQESKILKSLNHDNILKYIETKKYNSKRSNEYPL
jgi:serine/threonine protein kinase